MTGFLGTVPTMCQMLSIHDFFPSFHCNPMRQIYLCPFHNGPKPHIYEVAEAEFDPGLLDSKAQAFSAFL